MRRVFRLLAVVLALSTSGVMPEVSEAVADEPCCPDEGAPVSDCPPGASCACCPVRPSLPLAAGADVRPRDVAEWTLSLSAPEPVVPASRSDIFHPPRA
jgi:hypothetical protein